MPNSAWLRGRYGECGGENSGRDIQVSNKTNIAPGRSINAECRGAVSVFMKTQTIFLPCIAWATILSGCVHSHHAPVVYEPTPVYSSATIAPTSERPVVRVYSEPETVVVQPSSSVTARASDLELADRIRKMFQTDPALSAIARNMSVTIRDGMATMTGTVLTQSDREVLRRAIRSTPGLERLEDRTQVDLNR